MPKILPMNKLKVLFAILLIRHTGYHNLKDFYFSIVKFTTSKIYIYECKADSTHTQYWKMTCDSSIAQTTRNRNLVSLSRVDIKMHYFSQILAHCRI